MRGVDYLEHDRRRSQCQQCGGSGISEHNRQRKSGGVSKFLPCIPRFPPTSPDAPQHTHTLRTLPQFKHSFVDFMFVFSILSTLCFYECIACMDYM